MHLKFMHRLMLIVLLAWIPVVFAHADEHITLQLKWKHQFQFAGYYAAIEKGYYRQEGLDVSLREAAPGKDPVRVVTNGAAEYGVGASELMLRRAHGVQVMVLAVIFQHSPFVLLTHGDAGIGDLAGKRIMLDPNDTEAVAMLKRGGLSAGAYRIIRNSLDLEDWVQGRVDAIDAYITDQPFALSQRGIPYRMFKPIDSGVDFYGDNLFTTEQEIHAHPERVKAFLRASLRGWKYAMQHHEEIIRLILKKYHSRQSLKKLRFEANAMQPLLETGIIPTGYMYDGRWANIVRTYQYLGLLPADFQLKDFVYRPARNRLAVIPWQWRISLKPSSPISNTSPKQKGLNFLYAVRIRLACTPVWKCCGVFSAI